MADILPPAPVDAPFGSYNWSDWYKKVRDAINSATTIAWSSVTSTPTTVAGYGITDAVTLTGVQTISNKTHTPLAGIALKFSGAITNGAGAAAGTLLTAPAAGNPTKWIPIDDNGTTRYIPAW